MTWQKGAASSVGAGGGGSSPFASFYDERTAACTLDDLRKAVQQRDPLDRGCVCVSSVDGCNGPRNSSRMSLLLIDLPSRFNDPWALHLLSRLLRWDPHERISPREVRAHPYPTVTGQQHDDNDDLLTTVGPLTNTNQALEHAYFRGPYVSGVDGTEHATAQELAAHDRRVRNVFLPTRHPIQLLFLTSCSFSLFYYCFVSPRPSASAPRPWRPRSAGTAAASSSSSRQRSTRSTRSRRRAARRWPPRAKGS